MSSYRISLGGDKSTKRKTWETHEGMWGSHVFLYGYKGGWCRGWELDSGKHGSAGSCRWVPRGKPFSAPAGAYPCHGADWDWPSQGGALLLRLAIRRGCRGASGKPPCLQHGQQLCRKQVPPRWGLTRRLRRGSRACSPMGRSHFSFGGERKVCKRKPAARRLREKGFYCPF